MIYICNSYHVQGSVLLPCKYPVNGWLCNSMVSESPHSCKVLSLIPKSTVLRSKEPCTYSLKMCCVRCCWLATLHCAVSHLMPEQHAKQNKRAKPLCMEKDLRMGGQVWQI